MAKLKKSEILQNKYNTLARLFGAQTGTRISEACRGKYRGTNDYSIKFNNGATYFISNGLKNFEKELDNDLSMYQTFHKIKLDLLQVLKMYEQQDKELATEKGVESYTVLDIDYIKDPSRYDIGRFYVVLKLSNGDIHTLLTSNIGCAIRKATRESTAQEFLKSNENDYEGYSYRQKYLNAGHFYAKEDFVFWGTGYPKSMYTTENLELTKYTEI